MDRSSRCREVSQKAGRLGSGYFAKIRKSPSEFPKVAGDYPYRRALHEGTGQALGHWLIARRLDRCFSAALDNNKVAEN
jgi:hypothetical protein